MDKLSFSVIGVGARGSGLIPILAAMPDVQIVGVCDVVPERMEKGQALVQKTAGYTPAGFTDWHEALTVPHPDAVIVATPWVWHIPIAVEAMKLGIHPATEVGAAFSVDDCWKLVNTYEETGIMPMLLENRCYNRDELIVLQMARAGVFGKIAACGMGYSHDLRQEVGGDRYPDHGRVLEYLNRNCNNYATHPMGQCAMLMNVNRGNRMMKLTAVSTRSWGMAEYTNNIPNHPLAGSHWEQGDVTVVLITLAHGEMIRLVLDTTMPRLYSHTYTVHGTRGTFNGELRQVFLEGMEEDKDISRYLNNLDSFRDQYEHPVWREMQANIQNGYSHGGQDYITLSAFVDSLRRDVPPPIDVYDMAAWKSISPLSEDSITLGGQPVAIPDFTRGMWFRKRPMYSGKYEI